MPPICLASWTRVSDTARWGWAHNAAQLKLEQNRTIAAMTSGQLGSDQGEEKHETVSASAKTLPYSGGLCRDGHGTVRSIANFISIGSGGQAAAAIRGVEES